MRTTALDVEAACMQPRVTRCLCSILLDEISFKYEFANSAKYLYLCSKEHARWVLQKRSDGSKHQQEVH